MEEKRYTSGELIAKLQAVKEREFKTAKRLLMKGQHRDSGEHLACVSLLTKVIRDIEEGTF